jgi:hypothetical protein
MTRKEKINQLNDIFAEINEDDNAVCYLTSEDNELIESAIEALSQESCYNPDEWCHDCSEYNQDKHCCPRFNNVIRKAVEEMKQEPVLDKMRAEIEQKIVKRHGLNHTRSERDRNDAFLEVLDIIDKYKAESEES